MPKLDRRRFLQSAAARAEAAGFPALTTRGGRDLAACFLIDPLKSGLVECAA